MPILEKYRHYFDIDPDYFPAVNESVINNNPDMWKKFFPHETFVKLLKNTVRVLERREKSSIWVEGAYGTGKSHAVLTLKKLIDASQEDTKAYFDKYHLDNDLYNNLCRIKNSGKILTVHRYGTSSIHSDQDLVLAIQESIEHALFEAGIENKGTSSLKDSVVRYLSDPENKQSFGIYVNGSYSDLFGGENVDDIITHLKEYNDEALHSLMNKIFKVAGERQIKAFTMSTKDLSNWIKEVIKSNNLKSIVFIWDEFTEYFYNNSRNLTGFQELAEIVETDPFFFILVTHVSSSMFSERDQDFIKLNGRFLSPHSVISLPENVAFQLMGAAMEKNKDSEVAKDWKCITDDLCDRTRESRKIVKSIAHIEDKELTDIIPIHPYTALLLKHISSVFDSNQRSMFDFIKNDRGDDIKGFQWFIDNYGPEDDNPLLSIDMLWEFFYDKGKDYLSRDVRSVLDCFSRPGNQRLDEEEKRVLKTVLLLQAISNQAGDAVELFIPNEKNIENAFEGTDMDGIANRCAQKLVRERILFEKQIGGGKFQYNAYINEVSGAELDKRKEEIDRKTTTSLINEQLADRTTVADVIELSGALKLRYELRNVSSSDIDLQLRQLRNQSESFGNRIIALVCFAKDDIESSIIGRKIRNALESGNYDFVFIDATLTPFGKDGYQQYREDMAQSMYQQGKNNDLANQYANNAKEALKKWKIRISNGSFIVFDKYKINGERVNSIDELYSHLKEINKREYRYCLEEEYQVIANMFTANSLKLGVECGAKQKTSGTYLSANPATKLEKAFDGAWGQEEYWIKDPTLLISIIKSKIIEIVDKAFESSNQVSIRSIYDVLKEKPFGFMPCNLTAFTLGFALKEYTNGSYSWSDGLTSDILDINKLKEMVSEVISLQITPNVRYKDKYIVTMTGEERAFNEATSVAFDIPYNLCTSVEQTRERIRNKMKSYSFPIWSVKSILDNCNLKTDKAVLINLIDYFCGIANSNNIDSLKTDNEIATEIGRLCIANKFAAEDLKSIFSKEKCTEGMKAYLDSFDGGILPNLAQEIGDNGQYINVLRNKFDADASCWVWNVETVQQKIREVILEYSIICESNKVIDKTISFRNTISEWCDKCKYIRISYAAAKNYLGDLNPFLELLCAIKKSGQLADSKKQEFLELIKSSGKDFIRLRNNQIDLFKSVCSFYLDGFSDEQIQELYQNIPANTFVYEKSEYLNLVSQKAQEYRNNLGNERLKKLWQSKTGTESPREWSRKHSMPILCVIDDNELQKAKSAFSTINANHPNTVDVEKAIDYIENATFFDKLKDNTYLDQVFKTCIIKGYAVMLDDVDDVKHYLETHIAADPYDWFGLPEIDRKLMQKAEAAYNQCGCDKALEKIDNMDVSEVKHYLKELIKDNMIVGMEILKEH